MNADMPGVAYYRISKDVTGEELGVTRQGDDCRDLAERRQVTIVRTIVENDTSARVGGKRSGFKELLDTIRSGEVRVIIAWNLDRLLRNDRDKIDLLELGQKHGIAIMLCRGPEIDLSTATGRMLAGMLTELAKWEIDTKSERHKSANLQKAMAGKPHASRRPFGYTVGYQSIRQDEADVYRSMVARFIGGSSCKDIAHWLNREGHRTTQGKLWYPITVRNMLRSPRYIAVREYQGQRYPGTWQPLIDRETWELVQHGLARRDAINKVGVNARKYLLTGKLICGRCGNRLTGMRTVDRPGAPNRRTYSCRPSDDGLRKGCSLRRNADALDHYLKELCIYRLDTPELAAMLHGGQPDDDDIKKLIQARDMQAQRKDMLVTDYSTGLLDAQEFAQAKQAAKLELDRIDNEISRHSASSSGRMLNAGQTVREAWDAQGDDWRRSLLGLLIHEITVNPGNTKPFYWIDGRRCRFDPDLIDVHWTC